MSHPFITFYPLFSGGMFSLWMAQSGVRDNRAFIQFTLSDVITYFQRGCFPTAGDRAIILVDDTMDPLDGNGDIFLPGGGWAICPPVGAIILARVALCQLNL